MVTVGVITARLAGAAAMNGGTLERTRNLIMTGDGLLYLLDNDDLSLVSLLCRLQTMSREQIAHTYGSPFSLRMIAIGRRQRNTKKILLIPSTMPRSASTWTDHLNELHNHWAPGTRLVRCAHARSFRSRELCRLIVAYSVRI